MSHDMQHLLELYAGRALEPLSPHEHDELRELESTFGSRDDGSFEQAATSVALAGATEFFEPLPEPLRQSLLEMAPQSAPVPARAMPSNGAAPRQARAASPPWRRTAGGWMAAAVCLVLAVFGWSRSPQRPDAPLPPTAARETLLRATPDVLRIEWSATEDPFGEGASGDVVWSNQAQEGYMTFHDLPVNDPTQSQYQLWIFDGTRNQDHPIDGGVFDVTEGGEAVVPIHAKLRVREPALFAVTLEPPGGVVVSDREHLLLVAAVNP